MSTLPDIPFRIFYGPADEPLKNFYIPALKASLRYDRSAGFFSSTALAVAAEGVAHLIQTGGKMRLLVGAELSEEDVAAISSGHELQETVSEKLLQHFPDPQNALEKQRLEVLAWMVAEGSLEIKVVLPTDSRGLPIPAHLCRDYYHPKTGVLTDSYGNQVAFSGSVNESATAWLKNYEAFLVFFSWTETKLHLTQIAINFEHLWDGKEKDWVAIDIPQAVRQRLLKFRPDTLPAVDSYEPEFKPIEPPEMTSQREKVIFQFLRDAPCLIQSSSLGAATAAVQPWPHQYRVADAVLQRYPERVLLCDEVGLGKTIEAGLIIRQQVLSRIVQRCLILAPKSVLRQWQEELYEKFNLRVPIYDGSGFWDVYARAMDAPEGNPWEAFPLLLAGSQLAKRADRREQILSIKRLDLLVVDEAHHARRKDFKEHIYRPNRLLSLIQELTRANKVVGMVLMTATPMQVHPVEVWDILKLLGLGARWGADEENFLNYFSELRKEYDQIDWDFIFDMMRDELETGGPLDSNFSDQIQKDIGPVKWSTLIKLPFHKGKRTIILRSLGDKVKPCVSEMSRRITPLRRYFFRNTRSLLREYQRQGILHANVPTRRPKIVRVNMRPEEFSLYEKIEEYISYFYQKYESERRGLGFIMTVYRRRLTSSFYAVRRSLERRLQYLLGEISVDKVYQDDDLEQEDLSLDMSDELEPDTDELFQAEVSYLQDFIQELRTLSISDSKLEQMKAELGEIFRERSTVLVFTQYTDTMDYLREQLVNVYGSELACYSGRGGEIWNGLAWVVTTKEAVKNAFKNGDIRIMLCTESASEGLNLQSCGVLINYDMPWNPMRVEQRIGRIDRIGQQYREVWISNYFYRDTIEDIIYQRLADRINWFEVVVGELQPILAEVNEMTRRLAMLPGDIRRSTLEGEINALRQRLQYREIESLDLDKFSQTGEYQPPQPSPVTLADIENNLTNSSVTGALFQPHPTISKAYLLNFEGSTIPVTFSAACYDEHPQTIQFLSYGNPWLDKLLYLVETPQIDGLGGVLRLESHQDHGSSAWYCRDVDGQPKNIQTLAELEQELIKVSEKEPIEETFALQAQQHFQAAVDGFTKQAGEIIGRRLYAEYLADKARAQRLLVKAALVELALGQQTDWTDGETYPSAFNEQAIVGLQRHGYPWGPLLKLAYEEGMLPNPEDPYYLQIKDAARPSLRGRFLQLAEEAKKMVLELSEAWKAYKDS